MELKDIRDNDRTQNGRFARTAEMLVHPDLVDKTAWNLSTEVNVKQNIYYVFILYIIYYVLSGVY
jgi:hypothetical protein